MDKNRKIDLYIGIVIILFVVAYGSYYSYKLSDDGVFTVARIEKFEAADQGGDLYITIYYKDKQYKTTVDVLCGTCISKYYFIKIFPDNPTKHPKFFEDKPVPDCIVSTVKYYGGWKTIPGCSEIK